ncbi:MAG: hypothetical protein UR51_C0007G0001 [Candidatus Moranbacteria bacterium GW2011_GWF1_34_10]|nr:MAG: hypothetical protein UR51_C0007G0001 [Candidatus Moranbacteria bacterium GW2011_GWF1_34_10]
MTKILKKTEMILEGRGIITLNPSDHMATGGEGSVYRKNDTVIKIYTDSQKMICDGMMDKITQLSRCRHKFIVTPENVVRDMAQQPIGYYMPYVAGEPLSRVFTNDYRNRTNFNDQDANILVDHMRTVTEYAHKNKAIMVDANELNWLVVDKKIHAPEPRVIDVDAWAIGKWGARVIMPSIRDWHAHTFDTLSDWFSWGVVTFQIYTGIHPYKGKLDGYKQQELERRMKDNASVFRKDVRLNHAVRDFSSIPSVLCKWYEDVFTKGKRSVPPSPFDAGKIVPAKGRVMHAQNIGGKNLLIFEKLFESNYSVVQIFNEGIILLKNGDMIDLSRKKKICTVSTAHIAVTRQNDGWLVAEYNRGKISCRYFDYLTSAEENISIDIIASGVISSGSRMFVVNERGLTEIVLFEANNKHLISMGNTWSVSPHATKWFEGLGVEDIMGAMHLIIPFGVRACATIRTKELDGMSVVMGRCGARFATVIALDQKGLYHKFEFYFDTGYQSYVLWQDVVDNAELIIAILPKGVCATIVADGALDIFVPSTGAHQKVSDALIKTGTQLAQWNNTVIYVEDKKVWRVRMK